jgi:crossover junction endodeoxyribonuclease RuvC
MDGGGMTTYTIGIDPGLQGAIAALNPDGEIELLADLPVITDRTLKWIDGNELQTLLGGLHRGATAFVERVSAMPKQGVATSFSFGVGFGSILGVLQALHVRIEFVTPAVWKKFYGLDRDKRASLHRARLAFPLAELNLAKHDGRAEALLIAEYGRRLAL